MTRKVDNFYEQNSSGSATKTAKCCALWCRCSTEKCVTSALKGSAERGAIGGGRA